MTALCLTRLSTSLTTESSWSFEAMNFYYLFSQSLHFWHGCLWILSSLKKKKKKLQLQIASGFLQGLSFLLPCCCILCIERGAIFQVLYQTRSGEVLGWSTPFSWHEQSLQIAWNTSDICTVDPLLLVRCVCVVLFPLYYCITEEKKWHSQWRCSLRG